MVATSVNGGLAITGADTNTALSEISGLDNVNTLTSGGINIYAVEGNRFLNIASGTLTINPAIESLITSSSASSTGAIRIPVGGTLQVGIEQTLHDDTFYSYGTAIKYGSSSGGNGFTTFPINIFGTINWYGSTIIFIDGTFNIADGATALIRSGTFRSSGTRQFRIRSSNVDIDGLDVYESNVLFYPEPATPVRNLRVFNANFAADSTRNSYAILSYGNSTGQSPNAGVVSLEGVQVIGSANDFAVVDRGKMRLINLATGYDPVVVSWLISNSDASRAQGYVSIVQDFQITVFDTMIEPIPNAHVWIDDYDNGGRINGTNIGEDDTPSSHFRTTVNASGITTGRLITTTYNKNTGQENDGIAPKEHRSLSNNEMAIYPVRMWAYGFLLSSNNFGFRQTGVRMIAQSILTNNNITATQAVASAITGIAFNLASDPQTITITEEKTLEEIYDFSEAYKCLNIVDVGIDTNLFTVSGTRIITGLDIVVASGGVITREPDNEVRKFDELETLGLLSLTGTGRIADTVSALDRTFDATITVIIPTGFTAEDVSFHPTRQDADDDTAELTTANTPHNVFSYIAADSGGDVIGIRIASDTIEIVGTHTLESTTGFHSVSSLSFSRDEQLSSIEDRIQAVQESINGLQINQPSVQGLPTLMFNIREADGTINDDNLILRDGGGEVPLNTVNSELSIEVVRNPETTAVISLRPSAGVVLPATTKIFRAYCYLALSGRGNYNVTGSFFLEGATTGATTTLLSNTALTGDTQHIVVEVVQVRSRVIGSRINAANFNLAFNPRDDDESVDTVVIHEFAIGDRADLIQHYPHVSELHTAIQTAVDLEPITTAIATNLTAIQAIPPTDLTDTNALIETLQATANRILVHSDRVPKALNPEFIFTAKNSEGQYDIDSFDITIDGDVDPRAVEDGDNLSFISLPEASTEIIIATHPDAFTFEHIGDFDLVGEVLAILNIRGIGSFRIFFGIQGVRTGTWAEVEFTDPDTGSSDIMLSVLTKSMAARLTSQQQVTTTISAMRLRFEVLEDTGTVDSIAISGWYVAAVEKAVNPEAVIQELTSTNAKLDDILLRHSGRTQYQTANGTPATVATATRIVLYNAADEVERTIIATDADGQEVIINEAVNLTENE